MKSPPIAAGTHSSQVIVFGAVIPEIQAASVRHWVKSLGQFLGASAEEVDGLHAAFL